MKAHLEKRLYLLKSVCFFTLLLSGYFTGRKTIEEKPYLTCATVQREVISRNGVVASASPLATKIGQYILMKVGNAIDVAIAVQFALAVVSPEAGNIEGEAFMVMHLKDGTNKALDFKEKGPSVATREMYLDEKGNPQTRKSLLGHLASGNPGMMAGIFESLPYAKLPLSTLMQPAINLAEKGYSLLVDQLEILFNKDDDHVFVYELKREVVGFVSVHYLPQLAFDGGLMVISYLSVDETVKDTGIAQALERCVTEQARFQKCERIQVHCAEWRAPAHQFYAQQGYLEYPKYFSKRLVYAE
jgi:predicted N-acetyltransferase YhbS